MHELVYTSAPRLLEAGKTGFGTLICTKGMPQPLISFLERISAFDRGAGVDAFECYTVYKMGSVVFHVFSRIGDCGADYTGRTNHVAHHFVVEEGTPEARELMEFRTPADVLLGLESMWVTSCPSAPGYVDERSVRIPNTDASLGAWAEMTGSPEKVRWMAIPPYDSACCLVFSGVAQIPLCLRLLHEGYLYKPQKGWGCGFSTALVGTIGGNLIPISCLDARQRVAGVKPGRSTPVLELNTSLAMPPEPPQPQRTTDPAPASVSPHPSTVPSFPHPSVQPTPGPQPTTPPFPTGQIPASIPQPLPPSRGKGREKDKTMPVVVIAVCCILALSLIFLSTENGDGIRTSPKTKQTGKTDRPAQPREAGESEQQETSGKERQPSQQGDTGKASESGQQETSGKERQPSQQGDTGKASESEQQETSGKERQPSQQGDTGKASESEQQETSGKERQPSQQGDAGKASESEQQETSGKERQPSQQEDAGKAGELGQQERPDEQSKASDRHSDLPRGEQPATLSGRETKKLKKGDKGIEIRVEVTWERKEKKFKIVVTGKLSGTLPAREMGYDEKEGWKLYIKDDPWEDDVELKKKTLIIDGDELPPEIKRKRKKDAERFVKENYERRAAIILTVSNVDENEGGAKVVTFDQELVIDEEKADE